MSSVWTLAGHTGASARGCQLPVPLAESWRESWAHTYHLPPELTRPSSIQLLPTSRFIVHHLSLSHRVPAMVSSLLLLGHGKHSPAPGALYLLFLPPAMLFPFLALPCHSGLNTNAPSSEKPSLTPQYKATLPYWVMSHHLFYGFHVLVTTWNDFLSPPMGAGTASVVFDAISSMPAAKHGMSKC